MVEKLVLAVQKEYPRVVAGFSDKLMAMWNADVWQFESRSDELLAAIRSGKITAADGAGAA